MIELPITKFEFETDEIPAAPKSLSDNIIMALKDLDDSEKDENYVIDMDHWHKPEKMGNQGIICNVCFAGAVLAKTLRLKNDIIVNDFSRLPIDWMLALQALDDVRIYDIGAALRTFYPGMHEDDIKAAEKMVMYQLDFEQLQKQENEAYEDNPMLFKSNMRKIANELKKLGL